MFENLREAGIQSDNDYYPWFIVSDFEAIQVPVESSDGAKLEYERKHIPVSV